MAIVTNKAMEKWYLAKNGVWKNMCIVIEDKAFLKYSTSLIFYFTIFLPLHILLTQNIIPVYYNLGLHFHSFGPHSSQIKTSQLQRSRTRAVR